MTIWVIEERWFRDNDYGGDWEEEPNLDFGYFTDFGTAQEFADAKNGDRRLAYDEYVQRMERGRADYKANHDKAMRRYETLVAAGFTDERKPEKPRLAPTLSYEKWLTQNARSWTTYSPLAVEEHA